MIGVLSRTATAIAIVTAAIALPSPAAASVEARAPYDDGWSETECWAYYERVAESEECRLTAEVDAATGRLHVGYRAIGRTHGARSSAVITHSFAETNSDARHRFTVRLDVNRYVARSGLLGVWLTDEQGSVITGASWQPQQTNPPRESVELVMEDPHPVAGRRVQVHVTARVSYYGSYYGAGFWLPQQICAPLYGWPDGAPCVPTFLPPYYVGAWPIAMSTESGQYAEIDALVELISMS